MRELNQFNKIILQKFSSRQAYTFIKGQYVPIISTNISDESVMDIDKRKYYIQNYDFTMLGYLIDEEEFEVKPAISRVLQVVEVDIQNRKKRPEKKVENKNGFELNFTFEVGETVLDKIIDYTVNMYLISNKNVSSWDVYINGDFFGTDVNSFPLNTNDNLNITITKTNPSLVSEMRFSATLL